MRKQTITLTTPLDDGHGTPLSSLTMREPMVIDELELEDIKGTQAVKNVHLFSRLCGVKPDALHKMALCDFNKLSAVYKDFLLPPPDEENVPTPKN